MKQLGQYKKYVVIAAVIQSILVIIFGYSLFKAKGVGKPIEPEAQQKQVVEQPAKQ